MPAKKKNSNPIEPEVTPNVNVTERTPTEPTEDLSNLFMSMGGDSNPDSPDLSQVDINSLEHSNGDENDIPEPSADILDALKTNTVENPGAENAADADAILVSARQQPGTTGRKKAKAPSILTVESKAVIETARAREETIWHEIRTAYHMRRILTGVLSGVEKTESGKTIAVIDYNGYRVIIPASEMMISLGYIPTDESYNETQLRINRILNSMLGADIDFVIMGIENKSHSVVASRKAAIMRKRKAFYMDADSSGMYRVYEGRVVQARIIAVAQRVIRVEVFGVECSIHTLELSWEWLVETSEKYCVGDHILVRILSVERDSIDTLSIKASAKSAIKDTSRENLKKCQLQNMYAGCVTNTYNGVVFIRLVNGANVIAHICKDRRVPGRKDDVSVVITRIDEEQGIALGIITRILRQNI